ncbi:MAG: polysaccharide deacetylase family protein [Thermoplasmata archaeon]|nr:MAG: polysaccharide deacetylase family protein [Thermoplasmata archaeon]
MKIRTILTVDVDHFPGSEDGIERILDIFERRGIKAMFFVAGKFALEYANVIMKIDSMGHEIGCHGYSHGLDTKENFVDLGFSEQKKRIEKSSEILKEIIGKEVRIFRAPYAMINHTTLNVLEKLGYECDSSVAALRYDFGMGMANNIKAFFAPTRPYHPSSHDIFKKGYSGVLEVPMSAFIAPLTLSGIRTFGIKRMCNLFNISSHFFDPVVFYLHPYEVMALNEIQLWDGLPKRHKKNRGEIAIHGLERFIDYIGNKSEFLLFKNILEAEKKERG